MENGSISCDSFHVFTVGLNYLNLINYLFLNLHPENFIAANSILCNCSLHSWFLSFPYRLSGECFWP